jgi:hypothetical protein
LIDESQRRALNDFALMEHPPPSRLSDRIFRLGLDDRRSSGQDDERQGMCSDVKDGAPIRP